MEKEEINNFFLESNLKFNEIIEKVLNLFKTQLFFNINFKEVKEQGGRRFIFFPGSKFRKHSRHIIIKIFYDGGISIKRFYTPKNKIEEKTTFTEQGLKIWDWIERNSKYSGRLLNISNVKISKKFLN